MMKPWQWILVGILFGFVAGGVVLLIAKPFSSTPLTISAADPSMSIMVDVDGAVLHPGVYTLRTGDRVNDAIQAAGGYTEDADTSEVNLATFIQDGQKVWVPGKNPGLSSPPEVKSEGDLTNLNTATLEELIALPGIGEQKANALILYRTTYGDFGSIEDVLFVPGFGQSLLDTIRNYVTVEK